MLSTLFPFFLGLVLYRLNPIKLESYYDSKEAWLDSIKSFGSKEIPWKYFWLMLLFLVPSSLGIAFVQNLLFEFDHSYGPKILFINRANDFPVYSLLIGLFMGLCVSSILLSHLALRQGNQFVKQLLSLTWNGSYIYNNIKTFKTATIALGIGLTLLNYWTSHIFLEVNEEEIKYSTWLMPFSESRNINEIACVNTYKRRIAPNGKSKVNPTVEVVYSNGTSLDTYYLVYPYHHDDLITAIQTSTGHKVPIYIRATEAKNGMVGNCT